MFLEVKEISSSDINALVVIHDHAFPSFFLTRLGDRFLALYYRTVKLHKEGILLGCYKDGLLVGFCAATMKSASFHSSLIKENLADYIKITLCLFFMKPSAIVHLYKNLKKNNASVKDSGDYAELLSIGVDSNCQGEGIGKVLLLELEKVVVNRGGCRISLTTDYDENVKVQKFYSLSGYSIFYEFIAYPKRRMYRYIKNLNKL